MRGRHFARRMHNGERQTGPRCESATSSKPKWSFHCSCCSVIIPQSSVWWHYRARPMQDRCRNYGTLRCLFNCIIGLDKNREQGPRQAGMSLAILLHRRDSTITFMHRTFSQCASTSRNGCMHEVIWFWGKWPMICMITNRYFIDWSSESFLYDFYTLY